MLTIWKDGEIYKQAKDERALFIATYESEKRKKNTLFNLTEKDREDREGLTKHE